MVGSLPSGRLRIESLEDKRKGADWRQQSCSIESDLLLAVTGTEKAAGGESGQPPKFRDQEVISSALIQKEDILVPEESFHLREEQEEVKAYFTAKPKDCLVLEEEAADPPIQNKRKKKKNFFFWRVTSFCLGTETKISFKTKIIW